MTTDPLAQFKQWISIEKPKSPEELNKDEEYDKNDGSKFREWKETWGWLTYGKFKIPENWINPNNEVSKTLNEDNETIDMQKIKENPNYPILERFNEIPWIEISNNDLNSIIKAFEWKDIMKDYKDVLWNIEVENKLLLDYLSVYLSNTKKPELKETITNDTNKELPKDFTNSKIDFLQKKENNTVQLLIKNYISFPDGIDWKANFEKDIDTTIKVSLNSIIYSKQFPRTETFEKSKKVILEGDNLDLKFEALNYINTLVNTKEWINGKKTKQTWEKINLEQQNEIDESKLNFEIKKLKLEISKEQNIEKKESMQEELKKLEEAKENLDKDSWEAFSGIEDIDFFNNSSTNTNNSSKPSNTKDPLWKNPFSYS